jgi:hypothetical protein
VETLPGQLLVDPAPQVLQVLGDDSVVGLDQSLLDPAGVGDQHQHDHVRAEPDQLHVTDAGPVQGRRGHHCGVVGEAGQQQRGALERLLQAGGALQVAHDRVLLGAGEVADARQRVDVVAVAPVGRHPPCAGVRVREEALLLERGQLVADGRR